MCVRSQTSPRSLGQTFVFPPASSPSSLCTAPAPRGRSPTLRSPELLGVNVGQRVRRLSSPGGEERGEGDGQEERGGECAGGERREERRRQAQLLQIHRELQNVEVSAVPAPPSAPPPAFAHRLLCLHLDTLTTQSNV